LKKNNHKNTITRKLIYSCTYFFVSLADNMLIIIVLITYTSTVCSSIEPLYTSTSNSPDNLAVVTPAVIEPLTFTAVLPMSINGSTEISNPANATGRFNADNTRIAANVAPPPTPATPNELSATTAISVTINCASIG